MRYRDIISEDDHKMIAARYPDSILGAKARIGLELERFSRPVGSDGKPDHDAELDPEHQELLDQYGLLDEILIDASGNLPIYRVMNVTRDWIDQAGPDTKLGIYWATVPTEPLGMSVVRKDMLVIEALLAPSQQCWEGIMSLHHQGENEVQIESTGVTVVALRFNGQPIAPENWIGKTFDTGTVFGNGFHPR